MKKLLTIIIFSLLLATILQFEFATQSLLKKSAGSSSGVLYEDETYFIQ